MSLRDLFRFTYKLPQTCPGCAARMAHIEDLQNLLKSEREGNAILQSILLQKSMPPVQQVETEAGEIKPLRQMRTARQLRQQAEQRERAEFPNAKEDYWTRVQAEYDRAGKLPGDKEVPKVVENG